MIGRDNLQPPSNTTSHSLDGEWFMTKRGNLIDVNDRNGGMPHALQEYRATVTVQIEEGEGTATPPPPRKSPSASTPDGFTMLDADPGTCGTVGIVSLITARSEIPKRMKPPGCSFFLDSKIAKIAAPAQLG